MPLSGSDYVPSDEGREPPVVKEKRSAVNVKKTFVDVTLINRNKMDKAQRAAIERDQRHYEVRKAQPDQLVETLRTLSALKHGVFLTNTIICNYILDHWWDLRFSPGRRPIYLPSYEINDISTKIFRNIDTNCDGFEDGPFSKMYRSTAPMSEDKRVCFFLHRDMSLITAGICGLGTPNHFFPVLFDYQAHKAFVYGAVSTYHPESGVESGRTSNWASWLGPALWIQIYRMMGWGEMPGDSSTTSVVSKNWRQVRRPFVHRVNGWCSDPPEQNGVDCGMYTLSILEKLTQLGESEDLLDDHSTLDFDCCSHSERQNLLVWTAQYVKTGLTIYSKQLNPGSDSGPFQRPDDIDIDDSDWEHIMTDRFTGVRDYWDTAADLTRSSLTCTDCIFQREERRADVDLNMGLVTKQLVLSRPQGRSDAADVAGDANDASEDDREAGDASDNEDEADPTDIRRQQLLHAASQLGGEVVTGRKERKKRSKLVQPYAFGVEIPSGVMKPFDPKFDSYHTGPTTEMFLQSLLEISLAFLGDPSTARWSTVGARFSDHGYRRTAGGFHQFYLDDPPVEEQLAHFFPTPPRDVLAKWKRERNAAEVDQIELRDGDQTLPAAVLDAEDMEVLTLHDMAELGRKGKADVVQQAYLTGQTKSGSYIRLDIHKSRRAVKGLKFSADVDSVIWLTDRLRVNATIQVHITPYLGMKAPIRKHNHTYVNLYWPRTELEKKRGKVSSVRREVAISNLPNTQFAHYGKSEGSPEIFVVFPRMKHKYPLRSVSETKLPYEVEAFWLENLVYPGLKRLSGTGTKPYLDVNLEQGLYKCAGSRHKTKGLSSEQLEEFQKHIHDILKEHEGDEAYSRFGSFFFLLQIVGIKFPMSMDENWAGLWDKLATQYPMLDWNSMAKPENGELLVDLGFGIHPPEEEGVVGFWDVDVIRQGFDYGGYNQGTTHGTNTFPAIGGIHAEMGSTRRRRTHIAHRLTYNLVYEVLRSRATRVRGSFFPFLSAYNADESYHHDIRGVIEAYNRCKSRSYGVRDEYRCRASCLKRVLPLMKAKVREVTVHVTCQT
jgi:hypothetical protein